MDPLHHRFFQPDHSVGGNEREHMFEKPLTPSDVGKLNRLVIPKQHAEKYFPIARESGEKGLLLNFEDESGKEWHFRYSYWTSSQSYVLTKGWSRFVKEKRLDAGDVVLFQRRRGDHLLYIGCRRRGDSQTAGIPSTVAPSALLPLPWNQANYTTTSPSTSCFYTNSMKQDCHLHAGSPTDSSTTTVKPVNTRRLRLFGVNLECGPEQ